jgi:hypothetical protein
MQVISVAFILTRFFGFWDKEAEQLGMPGKAVFWNFSGFF